MNEGTIKVSQFEAPLSEFLSEETRAVLRRQTKDIEAFAKACPQRFETISNTEQAHAYQQGYDKHYYPAIIERLKARYPVTVETREMAGVPVDVCTPRDGIHDGNRERVLINLHGGAFIVGKRWGGQLEAIPIAAVGGIKVVAVDYRMLPEHQFPAGSEDVEKVYRALLEEYRPENIGIYGCSAGAMLTAQSLARLQKLGLPTPGAAGIFCAGPVAARGDSNSIIGTMFGIPGVWPREDKVSYFSAADLKDPQALPMLDPKIMARFPDSLLITSTRDILMSAVVVTHARLVKLGVKADLHVWEGLTHAFFYEPDLPESRDVYQVIARFFAEHLGKA